VYAPDFDGKPYCQECFTDLWRYTEAQLKAIEAFRAIDWRE
jgi:hypothetical protein